GDAELARSVAVQAAELVWARRQEFLPESLSAAEAIQRALAVDGSPVVINETSDNCGGGTPGDGTHLLRAMLEARLDNSCFVINGIDVTRQRIIALKSSQHVRAAFEPLAAAIITADTPGLTTLKLDVFDRSRTLRPIWPLDPEAVYPA